MLCPSSGRAIRVLPITFCSSATTWLISGLGSTTFTRLTIFACPAKLSRILFRSASCPWLETMPSTPTVLPWICHTRKRSPTDLAMASTGALPMDGFTSIRSTMLTPWLAAAVSNLRARSTSIWSPSAPCTSNVVSFHTTYCSFSPSTLRSEAARATAPDEVSPSLWIKSTIFTSLLPAAAMIVRARSASAAGRVPSISKASPTGVYDSCAGRSRRRSSASFWALPLIVTSS